MTLIICCVSFNQKARGLPYGPMVFLHVMGPSWSFYFLRFSSKVELLLREIPAKAEDPKAFRCFSNCAKARNGKRLGSSNFHNCWVVPVRGVLKFRIWIRMLLCSKNKLLQEHGFFGDVHISSTKKIRCTGMISSGVWLTSQKLNA